MCIINGMEITVHEKEKKFIYKVMRQSGRNIHLIFKRKDGLSSAYLDSDSNAKEKSLSQNTKLAQQSVGFDAGFGFHGFLDLRKAGQYRRELKSNFPKLVICKFQIPQGARYRYGEIDWPLFGAGLLAVAAERIQFVKKLKV